MGGQQAVTRLASQSQLPACRRKASPDRSRTPTPAAPAAVVPTAPAAEETSKQPAAHPAGWEAPSGEASRPVTRSQAKSSVPSHPPDRSWFKALLYSSSGGRHS